MISDYYELDHDFPNSYVAVEIMAYVEFVRRMVERAEQKVDQVTEQEKGHRNKP